MKKILLLMVGVLCSLGMWAAATTIFDASASGWKAEGVDLTSGKTTVGDVTWYGGGSAAIATGNTTINGVSWTARLKFGGKSTIKTGTLTRVFEYTATSDGTIKVYAVTGSADKDRYVYVTQAITSTDKDPSKVLAKVNTNVSGGCEASATVTAGKVYVYADDNIGVYGITFEASGNKTTTTVNAASVSSQIIDNTGTLTSTSIQCGGFTASGTNLQAGSGNNTIKIDGTAYVPVKYEQNTEHEITAPVGYTISGVSAYAVANKDDITGKTYTISTTGQEAATLGARESESSPSEYVLAKNAAGNYSFTLSGGQCIVVLKVAYSKVENVDVKVSSAGYATLYYGSDLIIPDDVTAYVIKEAPSGTTATMTKIDDGKIKANTGVILKAEAGTYNFVTTTGASDMTSVLKGSTEAVDVTGKTVYTLGANSEGVVGLRLYSGTSVRAYSAYYAPSQEAKSFINLSFDGAAPTAINTVSAQTKINGAAFNLAGQRVNANAKGLVIINGKKYLNK